MPLTDAELIERLQAGEDAAYQEVIARYGDALYRYIYRITGDAALSEDLLGETYLRLVEKIDDFRYQGAPLKAWLYRVAHNMALNAMRSGRRIMPGVDLELVLPPADDPAATVGLRLEAQDLREAITQLTEEQQQVLLLRFFAGMSPGEVARTIDKSETAVKQMQLRALRSLGRLMGQRDG
ncbi:MAG TPA: sigma-70 family RNA polymerase sigma factor [Roseiflexaceae bacterium]|nr:sigma-70 family RNA polymerase sigma factor [Roseiflexaceae bacterium]HMP42616.1 sigma-70 family RNA polymerase sigma factor [Roseiflexaceae bacterium]